MAKVNTTQAFYEQLSSVAAHFNQALFDDALPNPLFTLKRGLGPLGYATTDRWVRGKGEPVCEITLNPTLFSRLPWLTLFQTIVEQQCRIWQQLHGTPGRVGYCNNELANKLTAVGLVPSSTGEPGGKRVGQGIATYIQPDGKFLNACIAYVKGGTRSAASIRWTSNDAQKASSLPKNLGLTSSVEARLAASIGPYSDSPDLLARVNLQEKKRKQRYSCPGCGASVWGRPGLAISCGPCSFTMKESALRAGARAA